MNIEILPRPSAMAHDDEPTEPGIQPEHFAPPEELPQSTPRQRARAVIDQQPTRQSARIQARRERNAEARIPVLGKSVPSAKVYRIRNHYIQHFIRYHLDKDFQ